MRTYDDSGALVPGPTNVPDYIFQEVYSSNLGSSDLEPEFKQDYVETQEKLKQFVNAPNSEMVILAGEGMLGLWAALKSVVQAGDKVLVVANGIYGYGFGGMANQIGACVKVLDFDYTESYSTVEGIKRITTAAEEFQPKVITACHCDTPSGVLNDISKLGEIARQVGALLYVDCVSSTGGVPVDIEGWGIDLGLFATQKCFSTLTGLSMVSVSKRAWEVCNEVAYVGYDALLPWKGAATSPDPLPYTFDWHALKALGLQLDAMIAESTALFERHQKVSKYCRDRVQELGLQLFSDASLSSPTVTAAYVPKFSDTCACTLSWSEMKETLKRKYGIVFGGSYGKLKDKVFRIGHMGNQARMETVKHALDCLQDLITTSSSE